VHSIGVFELRNILTEEAPEFDGDILVDRAGVGLFLSYPKFGKLFQNFLCFDFQLPSQLINANLLHKYKTVISLRRTKLRHEPLSSDSL
jgi:hypothetical protein